jgi:hypothetical protein
MADGGVHAPRLHRRGEDDDPLRRGGAAQADDAAERAARTTRKGNGVATESTNADGKSGSGRMVFFVLIAIAVVLFILGVTDSYTQDGPNIHPMDQFIVSRCSATGRCTGTRSPT